MPGVSNKKKSFDSNKKTNTASKKADTVPAKKVAPTQPKPEKKVSVLGDDSAFPRGGGSVLTPLEIKQASNEAVQDVLFSVSFFYLFLFLRFGSIHILVLNL